MTEKQLSTSPRWGSMTKLVIALTVIVVIGVLVVRFHTILGPVLVAFVLAYLLLPLASLIERKTPLSWRMTVNVLYLIFLIFFITLLTLGGVGLVQQIQSLIGTIRTLIIDFPNLIQGLSGKIYRFGPFVIDLSRTDWSSIGQQVLAYVEPALGRLGGLVGSLASGAASTFGWMAFILLTSYFFLIESSGLRHRIIGIDIPGYAADVQRLGKELGRIWNAFLRGQIIIFLSSFVVYSIVLSILGVRYSIGLALLASFANFLPYIGPAISWIVLGLVTYFQVGKPFGLTPWIYTVIVIGTAAVIDQVFGNLVAPRIMAQTLKVHPAFVLIAAILAANLFGIMGVVIAAPLLATLTLFGQYVFLKMLDKDPWPEKPPPPPSKPAPPLLRRIRTWLKKPRTRKK